MKLSLEIDDNHWNLIPSDMMVPPEKFVHGIDRTILACLGLNKIHITYHPDWEAPPSVIKNPDNRPHSSKRKRPSFSNQNGRGRTKERGPPTVVARPPTATLPPPTVMLLLPAVQYFGRKQQYFGRKR
ncbi:hypothetical protein PSTG_18978 [Puccinia striiformis f. sp. tritici PST-78]|uniref:Uncharacterized protein n=1 Tax=Puccinia striiformis f. sp. tritici PST-78 TaxID=1165861 RepID=A0A0L0UL13_9BASI|nr:hypothetical protein PSTG_18978 [Puccinia striiformis f. sp. tritici PST-78]